MNENKYYYQAGVVLWTNRVVWSHRVYETRDEAVRDANRLGAVHEGTPIVEYWLREYGRFRNHAPKTSTFYPRGI